MEHYALGIDIGGTNSAYGIVSKEGKIVFEDSLSTKKYPTAKELLQDMQKILKDKNLNDNILGIGIGAPNGNSRTGQIEFAPNLDWKGIVPICSIAEDIFHKPAILINDANAAAIGEGMFGITKGVEDFVTITLGTGLGSGVIANGELVEGQHGFAGEYGHIRVVPNGRQCGCGRKGCLETYASSTGVMRTYKERVEQSSSKDIPVCSGAREVFEAAQKGNEFCLEIVDYTANILGNALADFACFSDPSVYVLFGGLAQSGAFFADKVKMHMESDILQVLKNKIDIKTSALHHENAAVLGTAASIFWKALRK